MCLKVQQQAEIPAETTRIAHAAFPKGSALMRLRDELGEIFSASQFADLFPAKGQPASAVRAAMVWADSRLSIESKRAGVALFRASLRSAIMP